VHSLSSANSRMRRTCTYAGSDFGSTRGNRGSASADRDG